MILRTPGRGWDIDIYYRAIQAMHAGLDPYAAGLARQYAAQAVGQHTAVYVYPPLTLLALRAFNLLPVWAAATIYWMTYIAAYAGIVWAGAQCFRPQDRNAMLYVVP